MSQGYGSQTYHSNTDLGNGGGFMADSPGSASGSPGQGGRRSTYDQSLRPVTVKQVVDASQAHTDAVWTIEDVDIGQVTIIAQVISIENHQTNTKYWLDDGTGRIEARQWWNSGNVDEERENHGVRENGYVRVLGNIKTFSNKKCLNAANIRTVDDPHELYFHLLEAMTVTMVARRGEPTKDGKVAASTSVPVGGASMSAYNPSSGAAQGRWAHYPEVQRRILEFVQQQKETDEGVRVSVIAKAVGGAPSDISDAIDTLMDEGIMYSTIDEMHFKISE